MAGVSRAHVFLIDVLAPSLLAYAELHSDAPLRDATMRFLELLPPTDGGTVFRNAVKLWFSGVKSEKEGEKLFRSALMLQGCLHTYKTYCAKTASDCESCLLANS